MATLNRWLASTVLATGLGMATLASPVQAQGGDDLARVIVDVADVIFRGGQPYYRHGTYGDRLIVERDRYGRPIYYRTAARSGPPYGKAHGYWKKNAGAQRVSCDRNGRCVSRYYDPRYDRRHDQRYRYYGYERDHRDRYGRYERTRYWDGYRWRYRD